jgi:hypothetical protein
MVRSQLTLLDPPGDVSPSPLLLGGTYLLRHLNLIDVRFLARSAKRNKEKEKARDHVGI